MSLTTQFEVFNPELETIQEFFQRFRVQLSEQLHKLRNDDTRQAALLLKCLPVSTVSEIQRRLAPTLLTDATFDDIEKHLLNQFSTSKSTIGASVQFLSYKQQPGQSLEDYARKLDSLASHCDYLPECLDRLLRDTFVVGLASSAILSSIIQVCDKMNFPETLERAKLLETFRKDANIIHSSRTHAVHAVNDSMTDSSEELNKIAFKHKKVPNSDYMCYRCGTKGQHFSNDCYARNRTCHSCNLKGHLSRICQRSKNPSHKPFQERRKNDAPGRSTCNSIDASSCCCAMKTDQQLGDQVSRNGTPHRSNPTSTEVLSRPHQHAPCQRDMHINSCFTDHNDNFSESFLG